MNCRYCGSPDSLAFLDLGHTPVSNQFIAPERALEPEVHFPLQLFGCRACRLVQVAESPGSRELFPDDYPYFSSVSRSWLAHAAAYAAMAQERFGLGPASLVVEAACNDGYLLQYFAARGIPCLGVEPTMGTAEAARAKGLAVETEFVTTAYGRELARRRGRADLVVGNNVLAHVPDLADFVGGLREILAPNGVLTMEFPHLKRLVEGVQFDTVYHEHYSYFSLHTVDRVFRDQGLALWDVEELATHGGSLRVYAGHLGRAPAPRPGLVRVLAEEEQAGMLTDPWYGGLQAKVERLKWELVRFLTGERLAGRRIAGYGAAAKGNTLLNFCGIGRDLVEFVADLSTHKQGLLLPGSHIPVAPPERIAETRPDYVLILPWNLREEIMTQLAPLRAWGGKFVLPVPRVEVV
ncbi:MAG: class I SAM-dependent methyltransferase [Deltaproteobacteria bacterium]|nr:class I SAM-dependent methyltransferase [Deltaproteobacteria bacterium]